MGMEALVGVEPIVARFADAPQTLWVNLVPADFPGIEPGLLRASTACFPTKLEADVRTGVRRGQSIA